MLSIAILVFIAGINSGLGKKGDIVLDPKTSSYVGEEIDTLKNGLIKGENGLKETYYRNGRKNGIFKSYYKSNGKLEAIGFYEDDKPVGSWYYFNHAGQILMIEEKKGINKDKQVKGDDGVLIKPKYMSYLKQYDPKTGLLKTEGVALYFEDIEIDYFKYGTWKEY